MDPLVLERSPEDESRKQWRLSLHAILWLLLLVQSVLVCTNLRFPVAAKELEPWLRGILVALALLTTCSALVRQLPLQNVALALALILVITSATLILLRGVKSGSAQLPLTVWLVPSFAATVVLVSRGVARLILRPFRDLSVYGLWFLSVTAVLTVASFKLWWSLCPTPLRDWSTSIGNFVALVGLALFVAIVITPPLINKRPGKSPPPDLDPLLVWTLLTIVALLS